MVVHIFYQCTEVRFASFLSGGFSTSDAGIGGAKGATGPPIFGRSVNPIPTEEGRLSPPITTGTPNVFHLSASLTYSEQYDLAPFSNTKMSLGFEIINLVC